ncbi:oxaloacetate decarboxylase gamma chain [Sinobacterium norvegicum]|uniref:Probable oxaloacetate decarboxylase gamma chain n=1 Tax=Sinobacterium norvegicum TaxID=1641715 RepID=A0ABM9AH68_9GAMM|nr:OadG family protein [Sinobacterium norvegicum]CAH0992486.1 oxaloacetate decarboxylase gamma chain [Sinobacterium norvegicum]
MQQTVLQQGVDLMLFGMGSVFVFLTILVIVTKIMSAIVQRVAPEKTLVTTASARPTAAPAVDPKLTAAITTAIHQYRKKHK